MTDSLLVAWSVLSGVGAFLSLRFARKALAEKGGVTTLRTRLRGRIDRAALSLFGGRYGAVAGRGFADPSRALLRGAVASLACVSLAVATAGPSLLPLCPPVVAALACLLGRVSLSAEGRQALDEIRRDLPGASLLLSLLLDSGLSVGSALQEVLSCIEGTRLHRELAALQAARSMGSGADGAFRDAMARGADEEYHAFLSILHQGERMGTGLSRSLSDLAARLVEQEMHRAESRAQKAPVLLLAPLVLCFFPSVAILILSPVILSLVASGGMP